MAHDDAYRAAELKIEEVRRSGATVLDLSQPWNAEDSEKLTKLPDSLWDLTTLQSLYLSGNQLTTLPEAIGQLTELQSLNLSGNQLTALPDAVGQLTYLQWLQLSSNRLMALTEAIDQLTRLQLLSLMDNQLTTLPEAIGQLTGLQSLDLSRNQLLALPEAIGKLSGLQSLSLWGNQLTELPESIGQLGSLQLLTLSGNQLTALPEAIGQLQGLQFMYISGNQLTALPEAVSRLTALQLLNLSKNKLEMLPEAIGQLTELQRLDLSDNLLVPLPEAICQLTRLQSLNLANNQLTTLPEAIGQFTGLQSLDLSRNQLEALPEAIGHLTGLQSLDLIFNSLEALPGAIGHLTGLQSLDLRFNRLEALPDAVGQLIGLQSLDLSRNRLAALPEAIGQLTGLQSLALSDNRLTALPEAIGRLTGLQSLDLSYNRLAALPKDIGYLTGLRTLNLSGNQLATLPDSIGNLWQLVALSLHSNQLSDLPSAMSRLAQLRVLSLADNQLTALPECVYSLENLVSLGATNNEIQVLSERVGNLRHLASLILGGRKIITIPNSEFSYGELSFAGDYTVGKTMGNALGSIPKNLTMLSDLRELILDNNPLNPELAAAYEQGLDAVMAFLHAQKDAQIVLNEAKLILVGEGEVGKTSLLAALRGEPFVENRPTTHGVEVDIRSLVLQEPANGTEITLNGWDFGGQNIYRHTHQLFFTSPAVYLVVWEPRRGPEQCRVNEWIKMIKHRAYDESRPAERPRILIVATHGGPTERLAHIDEQAIRDEFGDMIAGFYHVDSKPDADGIRYQLDELKAAIGREAAAIPSVGRMVPLSWKTVLEALRRRSEKDPYIRYEQFRNLCHRHSVANELASTYAVILNELGYLIYYRGDETLQETVILKPDYLSKAVSFVLEDKVTKDASGLVEHERLHLLWCNPDRPVAERYPPELHPIFLRLMTKFDLSYQVVMPEADAPPTSLMAQLVPGVRPECWQADWTLQPGDIERTQVCRLLDAATGRTVEAEGLMYRLIVRLHRYSLGRDNYYNSRHWKTGMILDDGYNGRAFIEEIDGDIYVTVRAAYPERFLAHLCAEVQWLVEHFWKGLDARLFVPCPAKTCKGLLELGEMIDFKRNDISKVRCPVCKQFHEIDSLMTTAQSMPAWSEALAELRSGQQQILHGQRSGFEHISTQLRVLMSQTDEQYANLLAWLSDPAKVGPRLFSFEPANRTRFDPRSWTKERFYLTLWCEHSRNPLPFLNGPNSRKGIVEIELTREWFKTAAPFLKFLTGTLSLILPVVASGLKLATDEAVYKAMENQLDFGQEIIDASLTGADKVRNWLGGEEEAQFERGRMIQAQGSVLRELHALLKAKDPGYGGLVRVQNKRREFLWVHERFASEY